MARYSIVLNPDREQRGFTVTVTALPGCITEEETVEECVANAQEAITLSLDDLTTRGEPVPEEREHPLLIVVDVPRPDRRTGGGGSAGRRSARPAGARRLGSVMES